MIRTHWTVSAKGAVAYLAQTDYYATSPGELIGKGFEHLNIEGKSARDVFECLAHNLDPATGKLLRPHAKEGDRVGIDLTFNSTKSVGIAREMAGLNNEGDPRIEEAHREAVAYAMGFVEKDMQCRIRVDGRNDRLKDNRTTGNLMAYRVTHRDTRINEDGKPDPSLHDHVFVLNCTRDEVEDKWKAAEMARIKQNIPFYEAVYHNRLAFNLRELGYGVRREGKAFEIAGIDRSLIEKFSRRQKLIKAVAEKLGIKKPESKAKLGATTRLGKAKELADDLNSYYVSRLTEKERKDLQTLQGRPSYLSNAQDAVKYAIDHEFYRQSVVPERKVYETAIRHGIGSVSVEGIEREAKRQGLLTKGEESTTREVLAEEGRIIAFAREGKGTMRPLAARDPQRSDHPATLPESGQQKGRPDESKRPLWKVKVAAEKKDTATLSPEQQAVCRHIWESTDRVIMIEGDAGTGKTMSMQRTVPGINKPGVFLAPSANASRGTLREKGFANADTIARFLVDPKFRETARNGYIYIDEAPLAGISDIAKVFDHAKDLNARIILQGDRKQHKSVQRGNLFEVLDKFAGLPIATLKENRRQKHQGYRAAVDAIAARDFVGGHDMLDKLGWVCQVDPDDVEKAVAKECWNYVEKGESFVVVGITHKQNDAITDELRKKLKEEGRLANEETVVDNLVPIHWTPAQKGDLERYDGTEVIQFTQNIGCFKRGQRVGVEALRNLGRRIDPEHYAVYSPGHLGLSRGDVVRTTAGGRTVAGERIDNGNKYVFDGFTKEGNLSLKRGDRTYVVSKEFKHLAHGLVDTSFKTQGDTKTHTVGVFTELNKPGINVAQYYVTLSRGVWSAKVFSTLPKAEMREAIQKQEVRKSATELMTPNVKRIFYRRRLELYRRLREQQERAITEVTQTQVRHEGYAR